ncbi:hypothetical protein BD311DRAFT_747263 [Dichomitus squalens]|uniref:DUF6533 domain-containing protein n=1 Tax=Dichomitus squalens TaxID=114155 RepID=A0A4Q9N1Y9_9APHY|nr:hypothetical protein BD311DRAFT_747263 [Dichomitus squalens]
MSALQDPHFAADYAAALVSGYCTVPAAVAFLYDSIIITGDEIRCFWGRKVTGAAVLFWLNKYASLFYFIWDLGTFLEIPNESCVASGRGLPPLQNFLFLIVAAFTGIRVFALRKSLLLASVTFFLSAVPFGVNFVDVSYGLKGENIYPYGCSAVDPTPVGVVKMSLVTICRSCLIAADCIAIWATWYTLSRRDANPLRGSLSISSVFLVDGTIFFVILLVLNALHMIITLLSLDVDFLQSSSNVTDFTAPISAILISRFLLHLQSANLRAVGEGSSQDLATSLHGSIVFERVVGSLGASLSPDDFLGRDGLELESEENIDHEDIGGQVTDEESAPRE